MITTLVLTDEVNHRLLELARLDTETGAVLLAMPVQTPDGNFRLLARELHEVPDTAYSIREPLRLEITSDGYVPSLARARELGAIPIWLHTHPGEGSIPLPSTHDQKVDKQLTDLFRLRSRSDYYGALVVSINKEALTFSGHLDNGLAQTPIDRALVVGDRLKLTLPYGAKTQTLNSDFERNIRAFGGEVQHLLGSLHVAVVGAGGTGSAVAEQLVRLGVRHLQLIDSDTLSASNVTRVYGSTPADVGRAKTDVLGGHLRRIAPDLELKTTRGMITTEETARSLTDADVIFGCTDDNAGRIVLSRVAAYLLPLVIDCGVLLTNTSSGQLTGIHGRVTTMRPGAGCLICRGRVDLKRAAAEVLTPDERHRLASEGYAPDLDTPDPAVVSFTTAVAAAAVTQLLDELIGFGESPRPSEVLLRVHDYKTSSNLKFPVPRHFCDPEGSKFGRGVTTPFLEMTWVA